MEWQLGPLSIATGGYIGMGPTAGDYCPIPLAIASDGYIRFDVEQQFLDKGGAGHGAVIQEYEYREPKKKDERGKLAALAIIAIEIMYDD